MHCVPGIHHWHLFCGVDAWIELQQENSSSTIVPQASFCSAFGLGAVYLMPFKLLPLEIGLEKREQPILI